MQMGRVFERLAADGKSGGSTHTSSLELVLNYRLLNFPQIRTAKPLGNNNVWEPRTGRRPKFVHRLKWTR